MMIRLNDQAHTHAVTYRYMHIATCDCGEMWEHDHDEHDWIEGKCVCGWIQGETYQSCPKPDHNWLFPPGGKCTDCEREEAVAEAYAKGLNDARVIK